MSRKKSGIQPKSKELIKEAVDIVRNTEDDDAAIAFLKDTLTDDYPDLDLGRMNLHEAIAILDSPKTKKKTKNMEVIEDLNKSLGKFIDAQEEKLNKVKSKKKATKKRRKRKR